MLMNTRPFSVVAEAMTLPKKYIINDFMWARFGFLYVKVATPPSRGF